LGSGARVWLVRHAEVHPDWQGRAYGALDVPLSPRGLERTRELGRDFGALAPERVLASPLARALALGRAIAERAGRELEIEPGLRELARGTWQGELQGELAARFPAQVRAYYADPWGWRGHGGETDAEIAARAWPPLERALAHARGRTLVLASHYNVMRVLTASALSIAPARSFALRVDPGHAVLLVDAPGGWQLHHANVLRPLAGVDGRAGALGTGSAT
jgi:probable phosphoglycerate mutase